MATQGAGPTIWRQWLQEHWLAFSAILIGGPIVLLDFIFQEDKVDAFQTTLQLLGSLSAIVVFVAFLVLVRAAVITIWNQTDINLRRALNNFVFAFVVAVIFGGAAAAMLIFWHPPSYSERAPRTSESTGAF
jgi:hypothetical protein